MFGSPCTAPCSPSCSRREVFSSSRLVEKEEEDRERREERSRRMEEVTGSMLSSDWGRRLCMHRCTERAEQDKTE